jgi:hypothetical protein
MELYALTNNFLRDYLIDDKVSLIWTERYTGEGDMQLVLVPTKFYIDSLKPGTLLSIMDSKEIMVVETQLIENGLLKISGTSLFSILKERYVWYPDPDSTLYFKPPIDYKRTDLVPGNFISDVVNRFAILIPPMMDNDTSIHDIDPVQERVPNLSLGVVDYSGLNVELVAKIGPIYDAVKSITEIYKIGMSLYLESASNASYSLKFTTYKGKDRTSNQTTNNLMRLSPSFDEISDVKELQSNVEEINVVYVYNVWGMTRFEVVNGVVTTDPNTSPGINRRIIIIHPKVTPELFNEYGYTWIGKLQTAQYYLERYKQRHMVDGQINSLINYKFGIDYYLGDIVEFESATGAISNARVTEYIRSHDSSGEKAYPTIVVE